MLKGTSAEILSCWEQKCANVRLKKSQQASRRRTHWHWIDDLAACSSTDTSVMEWKQLFPLSPSRSVYGFVLNFTISLMRVHHKCFISRRLISYQSMLSCCLRPKGRKKVQNDNKHCKMFCWIKYIYHWDLFYLFREKKRQLYIKFWFD